MKVCPVCQRCFEDQILSCSEENHEPLAHFRTGTRQMIPNYRLDFLCELTEIGETYLAVHTGFEKTRLLKIFASELVDGEQKLRERFLSEAQKLSIIFHPNLARVYESGTLADSSVYVVTEFFAEETLRDCLETAALTEITAVTITGQVAEGLSSIHALGVQHKNIRPENIVLTLDSENRLLAKIQNIDFGGIRQRIICSQLQRGLSDLRYFSPEQCAGQNIDAQTDVYGLGITFYEMIAGQPPFDARDADVLINKQINETPPPINVKNFNIRALLTHTLTDSLQKEKRLRLKNASIFARRIRHIEQIATHSSTPPPVVSYSVVADKTEAEIKNPKAIENPTPIVNQSVAKKDVPVFVDLTTTKLPPIELITENSLHEDDIQLPISFAVTSENSAQKSTLIEWNQPDDIPVFTKTIETESEILEPEFSSELSFVDYDDYEIDSSVKPVSEVDQRNSFMAVRPAISYNTASIFSNFAESGKLLGGVVIVVLLGLGIGGNYLIRQSQIAKDTERIVVKSSPNAKALPKPTQSENGVLADNKPAPKAEDLAVNNVPSDVSNQEITDLPNYQPRETEQKKQATTKQPREKKQIVKIADENQSEKPIQKKSQDEPAPNEIAFNKRGEIVSDRKTVKKNAWVKANEVSVFIRPRIVKTPKAERIIP